MLAALVAQVVGDLRRVSHNGRALGILAVERPQRIHLGARHAGVAQLVGVLVHVGAHELAVGRTALLAAHGVQQKAHGIARDAHLLVKTHEHDDGLGIDRRLLGAQALHTHLIELALTPLLRALGAEHRACVHELRRGRALRHQIVLHYGAHHTGRALGAQGQAALRLRGLPLFHPATQILTGNGREHLLGHHIGRFADAADEELGLLHDGRLDGQVPVGAEHLGRRLLELIPEQRLVGQKIARSLGSINGHGGVLFSSIAQRTFS